MKILISITDKSLNKTLISNVDYCSYSATGYLTFVINKNNLTQEVNETIKQYERERMESNDFVRIELESKVSKSHFISADIEKEIILYSFYL